MTTDDRQDFAQTLAAMAAAYDFECDEAVAEGFWITLNDLPLDRVKGAVLQLMRESKYRPKAAEIREIVVEQMEREARIARREERINQDYAVCLAANIIRAGRRQGVSDEDIRLALKDRGEKMGLPLHWPGEEPWNQRPKDVPRVEFKRP